MKLNKLLRPRDCFNVWRLCTQATNFPAVGGSFNLRVNGNTISISWDETSQSLEAKFGGVGLLNTVHGTSLDKGDFIFGGSFNEFQIESSSLVNAIPYIWSKYELPTTQN